MKLDEVSLSPTGALAVVNTQRDGDFTHLVEKGVGVVYIFVTMCDVGEGVLEKCDVTSKLATLNKSST